MQTRMIVILNPCACCAQYIGLIVGSLAPALSQALELQKPTPLVLKGCSSCRGPKQQPSPAGPRPGQICTHRAQGSPAAPSDCKGWACRD